MIRLFLLACGCIVLGGFVYKYAAQDPGTLLLIWGNTSIKMSLVFAALVISAIVLTLWICLKLCKGGWAGLINTKNKITGHSSKKAQALTIEGLIDYIEENWSSAHKRLVRSAKKVNAPLINYLAAARSAYEMGKEQEALELLHQAEKSTETGGLAVALTQARMQLANQQYEQALATLERARNINEQHPVVLSLLKNTYTALEDWKSLTLLLPALNRHEIGSYGERHELELKIYQESLLAVIHQQGQKASKQEHIDQLKKAWQAIPRGIKHEQPLVSLYAKQLMSLNQHDEAEKLLASALTEDWRDEWVELYGLLICKNTSKTLKKAEGWLNKHRNATTLLTVGRLCLQNQQWGRAIDYFKESIRSKPFPETYAELARVLAHIGETKESQASYAQGLTLASQPLPPVADFSKE